MLSITLTSQTSIENSTQRKKNTHSSQVQMEHSLG